MKLFATRHSHAELFVHLVWTTKERSGVLNHTLRAKLADQSVDTARKIGAAVLAFGGVADHVHLLVRYRPDLSVSDLARRLKAALSRTIRRDVKALPDFSWQTGYGAFSVSPSDLDSVARYIRKQPEHHADGTIWPDVDLED
jgi:REP element-mobilizing transposase RayT